MNRDEIRTESGFRSTSEVFGNGTVALAYLHQPEVAHSWHKSVVELIGYDLATEGRLASWLAHSCHSGKIPEARNGVVGDFLSDVDGPEWLFWVDTDMGFAPDSLERLLAVADPVERPIVGGLCFARKELVPDGLNGFHCVVYPTIFGWSDEKQCPMAWSDYPRDTLVQCFGTGSAFILIHRSVLVRMMEEFGPEWYTELPGPDGGKVSEDLAFCVRAAGLGIPVFVHTGVETSHLKFFWTQASDFGRQLVPPPADERVTVIVPVLGRPQNAEPFMRSLRASTGLADVVAVANFGYSTLGNVSAEDDAASDDQIAWASVGAQAIEVEGATTFAQKINAVIDLVETPWIFITGDDVRFHPGWLDHALHTANLTGAQVIGTQDMGNPRVVRGEHATHLLISTDYIREVGASWDGPGNVCHEYGHWFVDDEIVLAAKQRGVWAFAAGSVVEHLHPLWGKSEADETYRLGMERAEQDRKVFLERLAIFAPELVQ